MKKSKTNKVILVINAGSSSIKYKVFKLDNDEVIGSGQCEKIGNPKGIFSLKYTLDGKTEKIEEILPIPNHNVGTKKILDELMKHKVITNLKDIAGVGHRVVMGGTKFKQSTVITKQVKDEFNKDFVSEFFDLEKINKMLDDHHNDIKPNTRKIFTIYCFLIWYERYFILEK